MREHENSRVIGVFDDYSTAERVARELVATGIPRENVDVQSNLATGSAGHSMDRDAERTRDSGGISGFFRRLFGSDVPDDYHGHYAEAVRRGSAVVCVDAPAGTVDRAIEVMNHNGAIDIDERVEAYRRSGYDHYDPEAPPYTYEQAKSEREGLREHAAGTAIPVVEEELRVGKRAVRRGGVRVFSRVVEQPVQEEITLREEHARVERRPVDRNVTDADVANLREQSIEVTETVEEPVVRKRARVKEEVVVGKEINERTEQIRDSVRHTEVHVEQMGEGKRRTADYRDDFRRDYDSRYARSGMDFDTVEPAYDYGYTMASDPRYRGRSWEEVESDLRSDYTRRYPNSTWEKMKDAVRYGWDKVTGKH